MTCELFTTKAAWLGLTELSCRLSVKGDAGVVNGEQKYETWFAKVLSLPSGITKQPQMAFLDITRRKNQKFAVAWFYKAGDIVNLLNDNVEDDNASNAKEALRDDEYILGTRAHDLSPGAIIGW